MLHVLHGEDTLAIMPTGAGKSLCYQLPAQLMSGMAIVVSPLISLMKDQHQKILDMGFTSQHLSSELTRKQTEDAIERLSEGRMDIQFVTPEKLENPQVLNAFRKAGVSLFVVDEAHCISEWGHDFRPAYLTLSKAVEALGHPTVLALTATATTEVTRDIQERLHFKKPSHVVRISYRRDNLVLRAREYKTEQEKFGALMRMLTRLHESVEMSGIIYCASVKQTEALAQALKAAGIPSAKYHGRMRKSDRRRAQERFMSRTGIVMVATSAFGMGIDKPDVRFVINYQIPNSIESYYQEVGRAGRDGRRAFGVLFYTPKDRALQRVLSLRKYPNIELVNRAVDFIFSSKRGRVGTSIDQIDIEGAAGKKKLGIILKMLEKSGFIEHKGRRIKAIARPNEEQIGLMLLDWEGRKSDDRRRLEDVVHYVHTGLCRWYYLLRYFGENLEEPCGHCDNCKKYARAAPRAVVDHVVPRPTLSALSDGAIAAGPSLSGLPSDSMQTSAVVSAISPLAKGDYVRHRSWGIGEVVQRIGPNLRVMFPGIGEKVLREDFLQPWVATPPSGKTPPKKVA